jgi:hypothetical protein
MGSRPAILRPSKSVCSLWDVATAKHASPNTTAPRLEFAKIDAYFQTTYETPEVGRVLRLTKEKARKSPEELAGSSQPWEHWEHWRRKQGALDEMDIPR